MRLSWNEIRRRAAQFSKEWDGEGYEKGQTQLFYRDFFEVFDIPIRRVASFEEPVRKLGDKRGYIDLFWKGVLLVEQKSIGRDLAKAKTQALDYFPGLKDQELPRFILLSDFQTFELYDLDEDEAIAFKLKDFADNIELFAFILGVQKRSFKDQDPVNIQAAELVGKIHDAFEESGFRGHDLEQFLVRIVFCLFADDTSIFDPRGIFLDFLTDRTSADGSDLGPLLSLLFQVLNTPEATRSEKLDEDLASFPYINGQLFQAATRIPNFDSDMRELLIEACGFDWSKISPAIFGSLFQSVMDSNERRAQGAHYTTEKNILKIIQPLFLDDLWSEFEKLRSRKDSRRKRSLHNFQEKLGELTFFDPACGCGNFLIISYRELRVLEIEVLRELLEYKKDHLGRFSGELDSTELSIIDVDQFYGIELGEFAAKIAETALWMMDHIMNNRLSVEFGQFFARIPLIKTPNIVCGDSLEMEWKSVISPSNCSYILGNPPFIGSKYQNPQQRVQVQRIANLGGSGGTLDYVCAWFLKAAEFLCLANATSKSSNLQIGFVSTNSITQGEQVAQLWHLLLGKFGLEISFAHRTFAWGSDARGRAHVHVVIIGLSAGDSVAKNRHLYSYRDLDGEPHVSVQSFISPYLFGASNSRYSQILVKEENRPINGLPRIKIGSKPIDGGNYIFSEEEKYEFLKAEPGAKSYMRPYIGSREFLNGGTRYILYLGKASPSDLKHLPLIRDRVKKVVAFRNESSSKGTRALAKVPTRYHVNVIPDSPFLVIPESSSEKREYLPIGWLNPPVIPSNLVRISEMTTLPTFALLNSSMHMCWLRTVGGRLKSDYRYSIGLVYNAFPLPPSSASKINGLATYAQAVLDARSLYNGSSMSDLYDPEFMPIELKIAHTRLDKAVEKLYSKKAFRSDIERLECLLELYDAMTIT